MPSLQPLHAPVCTSNRLTSITDSVTISITTTSCRRRTSEKVKERSGGLSQLPVEEEFFWCLGASEGPRRSR